MIIDIVTVSLFVIGILFIVLNILADIYYHKVKSLIWQVRLNNFYYYSLIIIGVIFTLLIVLSQNQ